MLTDPQLPIRERLASLIDWERRDRSAGMRVSTAPIADLLARLGNPHTHARVVHVAGSKGKSTLCARIDVALRAAGVHTARYTSPHLERLEERAVIDGEPVDSACLDRHLERTLEALTEAREEQSQGAAATWFDVLTAAAFSAFAEARAQVWIVECGLGGRLDSTNVVPAGPCALTTVELEHTAVLGPTRDRIAEEKAGIFKRGSRAVVGLDPERDPAGARVRELARESGAEVRFLAPERGASIEERNRALATALWETLGVAWPELDLPSVAELPDPRLPGRLERFDLPRAPVVLDGAHTPGSVALVRRDLQQGAVGPLPGAPRVVLALGRDKDAAGVLKALLGWVDRVFCSVVDPDRQVDPEELARLAASLGHLAEPVSDPLTALDRALAADSDTWVLAIGSLHLAGFLRPECRRRQADGPRC